MEQSKKSLSEINSSVQIPQQKNHFRRFLAFVGPAYLISIGYMDPGNWATDIAGGSKFAYKLIWVLLMSNLMAILLQSLAARLGIVSGMDLAQACASHYRKWLNRILFVLTELAIIATDLAEVLGSAIGLQLLFHIPILIGVIITAFDTFLILLIQKFGVRKLEAITVGLISIIGISFLVEIILSKPEYNLVLQGFIPTIPDQDALFIAIGILGATVMPHNLYLHSSLVQSRNIERNDKGIRQAIKYNTIDSVVALNLAFIVNAAILIMAAAVFNRSGNTDVNEIQDAYKLLSPILGNKLAPILFGVALIASGQASTITGTLTGQIIMEGFVNLRMQAWLRRLLTRLLAIIPAILVIVYFGEDATGWLLVLSQVILSLQLSFAVVPLIQFVSSKKIMKKYAIPLWLKIMAWVIALTIMVLNIWLVQQTIGDMFSTDKVTFLNVITLIFATLLGGLLLYIIFEPLITKLNHHLKARKHTIDIHKNAMVPNIINVEQFNKIAVALDFTASDGKILSYTVSLAKKNSQIILFHVIESAAAMINGDETADSESKFDTSRLEQYAQKLRDYGFKNVSYQVGYGTPVKALAKLIKDNNCDIAVFGSHGHKGIKDLIFGITANRVKDKISIPILIAK